MAHRLGQKPGIAQPCLLFCYRDILLKKLICVSGWRFQKGDFNTSNFTMASLHSIDLKQFSLYSLLQLAEFVFTNYVPTDSSFQGYHWSKNKGESKESKTHHSPRFELCQPSDESKVLIWGATFKAPQKQCLRSHIQFPLPVLIYSILPSLCTWEILYRWRAWGRAIWTIGELSP